MKGGNIFGELGLGKTGGGYSTPQHLLPPSGFQFTSIAAVGGDHALATLAAVPEPPSLVLVLIASVLLMKRRRRAARR
jgi:hypothetical protein